MRKLMWFTIGFAMACGLCVSLLNPDRMLYMLPFALLAAGTAWFASLYFKPARIAAVLLLGCCGAFFWYPVYRANYLSPASALDGVTRPAVITATDFSFDTGYGLGVDGSILIDEKSYQVRAYLDEGEPVAPGTRLEGVFRFQLTTPGSQKGSASHAGKGIFLLAYQEDVITRSSSGEETFTMVAARLRRKLGGILESSLPQDVYAFAKALLLGDTTDLSYQVDTYLKISGIRHVAAVSGLHVSILYALVSNLALKKRYSSVILGMPMLLLFAGLAGFTPSVNRACIMSGLMLLALLLNREYDGATALSFSVLTMLTVNPLAISSVSLQLSVASVAGIFLFSEPVKSWLSSKLGNTGGRSLQARLRRWFAASVSTTVSAMALTVPLCAWYFGTVSLIGVITNLLTLWVISFVFYALTGICAVHWFSRTAAVWLGNVAAQLIRYILLIAKTMASFPLACVYTASDYISIWLVMVYVLLGIFLISRRKRPGSLVCCAALGLCLALLCSWAEPLLYDTVITVLDVGQGQCILLQSEGKTYMVDCGGDGDTLTADIAAETLLSQGISRMDGLIISHLDRDHAGAAVYLLSRVGADVVILPPVFNSLEIKDSAVIYADREMEITWGGSRLHIYGEKLLESHNENSLSILLDTEKCDILITSDRNESGEAQLLSTGKIPEADILMAGHHGSQFSTSQALLETVRPEIVCISVGRENIYGHPAQETLERLNAFGCRIYRTDLHGTITIRR